MPFFLEIELKGARLTGHDHFWKIIRELGAGGADFTIMDVVRETAAHEASVYDFVKRLTRATPPIVEVAGWREVKNPHWQVNKPGRASTYRLLQTPVATPSLRRDGKAGHYGDARQNMWNILRGPQGRPGIDARELVELAATDDVPIALGTAKEFLWKLEAAGILRIVQAAANNRLTRYRMPPGANLGPKAPKLLKAQMVYDPNHQVVVGTAIAEEALP